MADDDGNAGGACGQRVERTGAGSVEVVPQQQVFRRVAAQGELRGQQQVGAGGMRLGRTGGNLSTLPARSPSVTLIWAMAIFSMKEL